VGDIFHHSVDNTSFEFPQGLHLELPEFLGLQLTKFMVLQLIAAVLMLWVFIWMARQARNQDLPRGRFYNLLETLLVFVREEVVYSTMGRRDGERFLPFLWTLFMYVLFCNLLGMVPFGGSPTGHLSVTGPLALCTFALGLGCGMQKLGVAGFWKAQVPHMDVPVVLKIVLVPLIFALEVLGLFIKHGVLAFRLFVNIFAGHTVLFVILSFIPLAAGAGAMYYLVTPLTLFAVVGLSFLELFIAFLQAYVVTFLSTLFISMALHPH